MARRARRRSRAAGSAADRYRADAPTAYTGGVHLLIVAVGLLLVFLGVVGIVSPPRVFEWVEHLRTRRGLMLVGALRLTIGVVLLVVAPQSRAPLYLQLFGLLSVLSGLAAPFVGVARVEALIRWWQARPAGLLRLWCLLVVAIGASFVWAVL